jgi:hypothetical protein
VVVARYIAGVFAMLLAILGLLIAWMAFDTGHVNRTLESSRVIDANFKRAAAFVDQYRETAGRVPTAAEFSKWTEQFPTRGHSIQNIELRTAPFSPEVTARHGSPPADSYALTYWRGEWEESYASWTRRSSMTFDPSAYYIFGSRWMQIAAALAFAIVMLLAALWIWPRRALRTNASLGH